MSDYGNQLIDLYKKSAPVSDYSAFADVFRRLHTESSTIRKTSVQLTVDKSEQIAGEIDTTNKALANARDNIIYITLLSVLLAIVLSVIIFVSISSPISNLAGSTSEIAKGNFKSKIDTSGNDEMTNLAVSVDEMRLNLKIVMDDYERRLKKA